MIRLFSDIFYREFWQGILRSKFAINAGYYRKKEQDKFFHQLNNEKRFGFLLNLPAKDRGGRE
jgi:hypothetical protein